MGQIQSLGAFLGAVAPVKAPLPHKDCDTPERRQPPAPALTPTWEEQGRLHRAVCP